MPIVVTDGDHARSRPTDATAASGDTGAGPAADILPTVAVRSPPPTPSETPARSANATPAHWPRGSSGGRRGGVRYPKNADGPTNCRAIMLVF